MTLVAAALGAYSTLSHRHLAASEAAAAALPAAARTSPLLRRSLADTALVARRRLSGGAACADPDAFLPALNEGGWDDGAGVIVWFLLEIFLFLGIAIVCDDYFVASLEAISSALGLTEDVAGATFMAAGSSAPELFASFMSLAAPAGDSELGVGTIVGSAVFNILVIVAATAIFAGQTLLLDWRPIARDVGFYLASIITLVLFFLDEKVRWWEGLISTLLYFTYVGFMFFNGRYMAWAAAKWPALLRRPTELPEGDEGGLLGLTSGRKKREPLESKVVGSGDGRDTFKISHAIHGPGGSLVKSDPAAVRAWEQAKTETQGDPSRHDSVDVADGGSSSPPAAASGDVEVAPGPAAESVLVRHSADDAAGPSAEARESGSPRNAVAPSPFAESTEAAGAAEAAADAEAPDEEEEEDELRPFSPPARLREYPLWLLSLPWYAMFSLTIPDCSKDRWRRWYFVSFLLSIGWIGAISYFMVEWAARIGCILGIPPVVMGNTVLAAGTSIPDALSSIVVAKQGMGDMAVANAIGSNVFDIWLGLGLPWFIVALWKSRPIPLSDPDELVWNVLILLGALIAYVAVIRADHWRLRRPAGYVFLLCYAAYLFYQIGLVWLLDVYGRT